MDFKLGSFWFLYQLKQIIKKNLNRIILIFHLGKILNIFCFIYIQILYVRYILKIKIKTT